MKSAETKTEKIRCPYCGYIIPINRIKTKFAADCTYSARLETAKKNLKLLSTSKII